MQQQRAQVLLRRAARVVGVKTNSLHAKVGLMTGVAKLALSSLVVLAGAAAFAQTDGQLPAGSPGPGAVVVHSKFGGQIFGFDIDQNGTEGVLSESQDLANGKVLAAVETFDQRTGQILKVLTQTQTQDDFVTLGVVGNSVGLVEHEHVQGIFHVHRTFSTINPLNVNKFNGVWTPPLGTDHLIMPNGVSRNQGQPQVAIFSFDNSGNFIPQVFSSNVAANTFGPLVDVTDSNNFGSVPPPIAFDSGTNQAILGGGPGCFFCRPVIGLVDLVGATFTEFTGVGFGFINGLAVDSADGIFCTTTEDDANVQFYSLATQTGSTQQLPGSGGNQFFSGADVQFDSTHKLFLVAQPNSSSAASGSTIYVYDIHGNLQETLNGFNFSNTFNVIPAHIALHPSLRLGYVDGPDSGVTDIQSFTY